MDKQTLILIAKSGGGKGTQARELVEYIKTKDDRNTFHLQSGKRIRNFLEESSYGSTLAKELSPQGELQPSFLSVWSWAGEMIKKLDEEEHLVMDGTPRRVNEAQLTTEALRFFKRENIKVVYINVSDDWSRERLKNRDEDRKDDSDSESINKRLGWFKTEVMPVIDYFKENDYYTVYEVNGEQTIEEVHKEILKALEI